MENGSAAAGNLMTLFTKCKNTAAVGPFLGEVSEPGSLATRQGGELMESNGSAAGGPSFLKAGCWQLKAPVSSHAA